MTPWTPPEPDETGVVAMMEALVTPLYQSGYYVWKPKLKRYFVPPGIKIRQLWKCVFIPDKKRNGPCKCGSGLKFKKCCLRRRDAMINIINDW